MTEDRWKDVKAKALDAFPGCRQGKEMDDIGVTEWLEFENNEGKKMRLEWRDQKVKTGEKTLSSRRAGSQVKVENVYSDTERSQHMSVYVWDDATADWTKAEISLF